MASKTVRGVRTPVPAGFLVGQTNTTGASAAQLVRAPNPFVTESRLSGAGPITGTITVSVSGGGTGSGTGSGASPHITVPLTLTAKAATNRSVSGGTVTATSPTYQMYGLAGTITPVLAGTIVLTICGIVADATVTDALTLWLSYGTGSAPNIGDALTGTQAGARYTFNQAVASDSTGFSITAVITGLTAGTAYWLDLAVGSSGGHPIIFGPVNCAAFEV